LKIELLGKKGAKEVLYALADKRRLNFTDLKDLVGSPTTASERLQELTKAGLIKRDVQADQYRTVLYSLTPKGTRIVELVKKIEKTR
jgi:DNA-binding HxlR family transcriptional regulator